jgi:iron complex outermembrane receptor protein
MKMDHRRSVLIGSVSLLAVAASAAAPAFARDDASGSSTVQEVVVTGIRGSLQKAIQIKRSSDDIVDAISAEDIGKLPDRNVADALQRIPGVNTYSTAAGEGGFDENDRVSIRGTPPALTNVTVDGHSVATGDWFILDQFQTVGRSVSFTLLPSEIVNNLVVDKSQNASLMEGGVAGSVDIQTRAPLTMAKPLTLELSAEGAYNSLSGSTQPQVSGLFAWKNASGTFGVLVQGFYEKRDVRRYGQETLNYGTLANPNGCNVALGSQYNGSPIAGEAPALNGAGTAWGCADAVYTPTKAQDPTQTPVNVHATPSGGTPLVYNNPGLVGTQFPALIGSALFEQQRTREGGDLVLQWRPNDHFELKFDAFYSDLNATNANRNYLFWGSNEFGANVPTSFTVKGNTVVQANFPLMSPSGLFGKAASAQDGVIVDTIVRPGAEAQTEFFNLDGKLRVDDRLTFKGQIGYTRGFGYTPHSPSFEVNGPTGATYQPSGNGWAVGFPDINVQSPNGLANDWAWNERFRALDTEFYAKVDGDYKIDDGLWKDIQFGVRYADHTRQIDGWDRGCSIGGPTNDCWNGPATPYSTVSPTSYPSGFNAGALGVPGLVVPIGGDTSKVINLIDSIANPFRGNDAHTVQAANNYWMGTFKVQESDIAGYALARLGGERWRANVGLRLAVTQENAYVNISDPKLLHGSADITSSAFGPYYVDHVQHTYIDPLPSANFTFDLKPDLVLRLSAAEAISRPDYSALGGTVSLNDLALSGNGGNPNLKPVKSDNYNASLEWYYGKLSNVTVDVYYMDLQSYVTYGVSNGVYLNSFLTKNGGPPVFSTYAISSPINTTGQIQGFELAWQTPVGYGFGFLSNYTYADGSDANGHPIVGDARNTFNITGYYENHGVSARLAYTYRSRVFIGLDRSSAENQAAIGNLDAAVNWNVTKNLTLTFQGLNLTDSLVKYYAASPIQPRAVYENGTQLYFGARFKY